MDSVASDHRCRSSPVKVTFLNGASLSPAPPVESKDERVRYLHLHEGDPVESAQLTQWIRQASELPGDELF